MRHPLVSNAIKSCLVMLQELDIDGAVLITVPEALRRDYSRIKRGADLNRFSLESVIKIAISLGVRFQLKIVTTTPFTVTVERSEIDRSVGVVSDADRDFYINVLRNRFMIEIKRYAKLNRLSRRRVEEKCFFPQGTLSRRPVAKVDTVLPAMGLFHPSLKLIINYPHSTYPIGINK